MRYLPEILIVAGVVLALLLLLRYARSRRRLKKGTGKVTSKSSSTMDGLVSPLSFWWPVRYRAYIFQGTVDGKHFCYTTSDPHVYASTAIGDTVTVEYEESEEAIVDAISLKNNSS